MKSIKPVRGMSCWAGLYSTVRDCLSEMVTTEQSLAGGEGELWEYLGKGQCTSHRPSGRTMTGRSRFILFWEQGRGWCGWSTVDGEPVGD